MNLIASISLALTPWVLNFTASNAASWNAWLVGAAIALVAIGALFAFDQWEEWVNLALGVWAAIAPWALGFTMIQNALYAHVAAGVIVAILAALELWFNHKHGGRISTV